MILFKHYDKEKHLDRVWYDSSNIVYSECDDNVNDYKTLRVTFKNGATYEYNEVLVQDYVMFKNGGTENSNGKAFMRYIKNKYEAVRVDDKNLEKLAQDLEELKTK